jgi:hypothetical protein
MMYASRIIVGLGTGSVTVIVPLVRLLPNKTSRNTSPANLTLIVYSRNLTTCHPWLPRRHLRNQQPALLTHGLLV